MPHEKRILKGGYEQFIHATGIGTNVFVLHEDEVLVIKRPDDKIVLPGFFHPVGGHVEFHENPAEAALKELWEETGIKAKSLKLKGVISELNSMDQDENWLIFHFTTIVDSKNIKKTNEGKLVWLPIQDFINSEKLFPSVKNTAKYLLDNTNRVVYATFRYKTPKDFSSSTMEQFFLTDN